MLSGEFVLDIPVDGIGRDKKGRFQVRINGSLVHVAWVHDLQCWFSMQDSDAGSIITSPVARNTENSWQIASTVEQARTSLSGSNTWYHLNLPHAVKVPSVIRKITPVIHYIWIGNSPVPSAARARIISSIERCPGYRFILHAHNPSEPDSLPVRSQFEEVSRLIVSDLNQDSWFCDFLNSEPGRYYRLFCSGDFLCYGAASDILRLCLLHEYGGIYLDVDDEISQLIDETFRLKAAPDDLLHHNMISIPEYALKNIYGNSTIASHPDNPVLKAILSAMLERLTEAAPFLCSAMSPSKKPSGSLKARGYVHSVLALTGPVVFSDVLRRLSPDIYYLESNMLKAYRLLNAGASEPLIVADEYTGLLINALDHYHPFGTVFPVRTGHQHSWIPC